MNELEDHAELVRYWAETSTAAAAGYPGPLTAAQKDLYMLLPEILSACRDAFYRIPEAFRPLHYLMTDV